MDTLSFFSSDTDECSEGSHQCSPFANCVNTMGDYECGCKEGYKGNGRRCTRKFRGLPVVQICKDVGSKEQWPLDHFLTVSSCHVSVHINLEVKGRFILRVLLTSLLGLQALGAPSKFGKRLMSVIEILLENVHHLLCGSLQSMSCMACQKNEETMSFINAVF